MAMMGLGDGHNFVTLFEADGTVNADDRAHMLDLYSGFGSTGSASFVNTATASHRFRSWRWVGVAWGLVLLTGCDMDIFKSEVRYETPCRCVVQYLNPVTNVVDSTRYVTFGVLPTPAECQAAGRRICPTVLRD